MHHPCGQSIVIADAVIPTILDLRMASGRSISLRPWLTAVLFLLNGVNGVGQPQSATIETVRVDGGYRIRYSDPDFDNRPMEVFVRDATKLNVNIVANIRREGSLGWRYDYDVTNLGDSDQQIAWWGMQVQAGSRILASPLGWERSISADGLSLFSASATAGYELRPGLSVDGWSLVSDSLPELKYAEVRGLPQSDIASADLPPDVRRYLAQLESGNVVRIGVLVPWIPTRQIAAGYEGPIDSREILRRAANGYAEPLLAGIAPDVPGKVERVLAILKQLEVAQSALARKNEAAAVAALRETERLVSRLPVVPNGKAVPNALNLILQYVIDQSR